MMRTIPGIWTNKLSRQSWLSTDLLSDNKLSRTSGNSGTSPGPRFESSLVTLRRTICSFGKSPWLSGQPRVIRMKSYPPMSSPYGAPTKKTGIKGPPSWHGLSALNQKFFQCSTISHRFRDSLGHATLTSPGLLLAILGVFVFCRTRARFALAEPSAFAGAVAPTSSTRIDACCFQHFGELSQLLQAFSGLGLDFCFLVAHAQQKLHPISL